MRKTLSVLAFACLVFVSGSKADTVATVPFLGNMLPQNETPPTSINSSATAVIQVHEVLDASGTLKSGSVEFTITFKFPGANTVTGLHIHNGAAGVAGPIGLSPTLHRATDSGAGV